MLYSFKLVSILASQQVMQKHKRDDGETRRESRVDSPLSTREVSEDICANG